MVRQLTIDYKKPARLDDLLAVTVDILNLSKTRLSLAQTIFCQGQLCAQLTVELVCVNRPGKPTAIPAAIMTKLAAVSRHNHIR